MNSERDLSEPSDDSLPRSSTKKRKASALNDTTHMNGQSPAPSTRKSVPPKSLPYTPKTPADTPLLFEIECPAKPLKPDQDDKNDDTFRARDHPDIRDLEIEYAIRPGTKWANIKGYRNVKLVDQTFTTGQIIYVNRTMPAPSPPPQGAPEEEVLAYDKANMWVGKIAQAKAESEKAVFLRVFWLYWPEELPMGRQPYHGDRELIMSNAMDIIDAQSIACAAEVSHWDERDDDHDSNQKERFWRQTLDVSKLGPKSQGGLSELRKHCKCNGYYNPDRTMYKCNAENCGLWLHEECLINDTLEGLWGLYKEGELEKDLDDWAAELTKSLSVVERASQFVRKRVEGAVDEIKREIAAQINNGVEKKKSKLKKKSDHVKPWSGKLEVTILAPASESGIGGVLATVKRLATSRSTKQKNPKEAVLPEKEWTIKLRCLRCDRPLD